MERVSVTSQGSAEAPGSPEVTLEHDEPGGVLHSRPRALHAGQRPEGTHVPTGHEAFGWLSVEELLRQASRQHARQTGELRAEVARLRAELGGAGKEPLGVEAALPRSRSRGPSEHLEPSEQLGAGPPVESSPSKRNQRETSGTSWTSGKLDQREATQETTASLRKSQVKAASILNSTSNVSARRQRVHYENLPCMNTLDTIVKSTGFEVVFMVLILANSICLAVEAEYQGYMTGQRAEFPGKLGAGSQGWGDAELAFEVVEYFFGCAFCLEALMKLMVYRWGFFKQPWNDFDLFVVMVWVLEKASSVIPVPALIMRLARLVKTLRLVRLTRALEFADTLNLIIVAIKASMSALVWSLLLLSLLTMVLALLLNFGLKAYVENRFIAENSRRDIYVYFGTFWRSFLSVIELTIGNWVPITRDLQEYISPWLAVLVVVYRLIMEIAILKVVTGVFLHETFRVAKSDSELMIRGKLREDKLFKTKMASLFREIDTDGNGKLSKEEFENTFKHQRASLYLGALGLDYKDTEELWRLVMQEVEHSPDESEVSTVDLERAIAKIRGEARSLDVVMVLQQGAKVLQQVSSLIFALEDSGHIRQISEENGHIRQISVPLAPVDSASSVPLVNPASSDPRDDCSLYLKDDHAVMGGNSLSNFGTSGI